MALNIGELFGSLSWQHDKKGADEFDRRYDEAQAKARKKIEAQLGAAIDEKAFAKYHESLDRAERRAKQKEAFKVALGADFDPKGFAAFSRAANQAERDAHKAKASTKSFSDELDGLSVKLPKVGSVMGLLKWPAIIAGAGMAAQAVSAATAGVAALGSALAPLSGALAAYPALGSAAAQGLGVLKLGTSGLADGLSAAAEGGKAWEDELKKLTPQQAAFVRDLKPVVDNVKGLKAVARENMLPGLERGALAAAKNVGVLRPIVEGTAKEIGHLADEAGRMVGSKAWGRDFETQGRRNETTIRRAGEGGLHLANALRNVTLAAGPLVEWMTRMGLHFTDVIDKQAKAGRESGKLAHFFDETRIAISRLARIGGDLATAFFNIGKEGKPLGDHILVNMVKLAEHFKDWTASASGQNKVADYFRRAKAPLDELGRLVHDVVIDFVKLGQGNQVAPLIRTIRVDLLPRFVELVDATTKSFGPPMLEAIKQVAILFTTLGGTNGPLTMLVRLVGKVAEGINKATDAIPGLGSAISSISTVASLYAALRIGASLSGLNRIIKLIKDVRTASAGTAALSAGAGAAEGAAAGAAARGGATAAATRTGVTAAIVTKLPIAAIGAAIAAAIAAAIPKTKAHRKLTDFFNFDSVKLDDQLSAVDRFNKALGRLNATGDKKGADKLTDQFIHLKNAAHGLGSVKDIDRLTDSANGLAKAGGTMNRDIGKALDQAGKHFADFRRTGSNNLHGIHTATAENMHFIKRTLGEDSAAGKEALARNFRLARTAVRQAMQDGKISVRDGLAEIQSLMRKELSAYGITGKVASSIIKHGNIAGSGKVSNGQAQGAARGGFMGRAGGGFFGDRGQRGQDTIHALVGEGEAILNHHQQDVVEGLLGPGFLDWLFANVRRPHYAALGGKVKKFAAGGIAGAVAAANQFEAAHFPYKWGGGHQATPTPFGPVDCSGAVSYVLQHAGVNIPTMTSGQLASAGKPGSGAITVFANPVHTFMRIGNRYFGTSGSNPGGGAGWMPDPGAGYKARFAQRGFAGGAGGGIGGFSSITAPRTGVPGVLGAIVQGALDATARGANQRADELIGAMGLGTGDTGDPGPVPKGAVGKARLMSLWRGAGGPSNLANIAAAIALAESGGDPRAHNPSGASGLWQILGQVVPGNIFSPAVNARNAVKKWHDAHGFTPWVQYTTGAYRQFLSRGGRVQRFAAGGRAGKKKHPIVAPRGQVTHSQQPRTLQTKSLAKLQTTRVADYDQLEVEVQDLETAYGQQERFYNLTDEVLVDPDTGALNMDAIGQRAHEIQLLIDTRNTILRKRNQMREVAERIVKTYQTIIKRLTDSLRYTKRGRAGTKQRGGIRAQIKQYQDDLTGTWAPNLRQIVKTDLPDTRLDLLELRGEKAAVLGTQATPQDPGTAGDAGTGTDAGTATDPAAAPPTALDIAAGVQAALEQYKAGQSDLIRNFGSNAVTRQAAFAPGGVLSGTPNLEGAALGALRGFGGGSNLVGSLGAGSSGPIVVVQQGGSFAHFATAPESAPTFVSQMRFAVENGTAG